MISHKMTGVEIGRGAYGRVFEVEYEKTRYAAKEVATLVVIRGCTRQSSCEH